jgi:alpha-D-ribose 1-methylphosphonate 5-triphosphate synthase subunit PhnG
MKTMNQTITRSTLAACLVAAGRNRVLSCAHAASQGLTVQVLQPAEAGMALMQWRDAVMHQPFYLGEVPLSRAAVAISCDKRRDAVWVHRLPGAGDVDELADIGQRARACVRAERQAMLKRTRVDFALLSETDAEDQQ